MNGHQGQAGRAGNPPTVHDKVPEPVGKDNSDLDRLIKDVEETSPTRGSARAPLPEKHSSDGSDGDYE